MKTLYSEVDVREMVRELLDEMPESLRLAVWLHFCRGFEVAETAEALVVNEPTIMKMLESGLMGLRLMLSSRCAVAAADQSLRAVLAGVTCEAAPARVTRSIGAIAGLAQDRDVESASGGGATPHLSSASVVRRRRSAGRNSYSRTGSSVLRVQHGRNGGWDSLH